VTVLPGSLCIGLFGAGQADKSKRVPLCQVSGWCLLSARCVWTHGICIAVLEELVTPAGKDNSTKLVNVFPVVTGQAVSPLASSLVYNSQRAISFQ